MKDHAGVGLYAQHQERIATLEARVKELEAHAVDMAKLANTKYPLLGARITELEGELAEAIEIINMTGVAPKFVEKHK